MIRFPSVDRSGFASRTTCTRSRAPLRGALRSRRTASVQDSSVPTRNAHEYEEDAVDVVVDRFLAAGQSTIARALKSIYSGVPNRPWSEGKIVWSSGRSLAGHHPRLR
jgi:hypothetical protein